MRVCVRVCVKNLLLLELFHHGSGQLKVGRGIVGHLLKKGDVKLVKRRRPCVCVCVCERESEGGRRGERKKELEITVVSVHVCMCKRVCWSARANDYQ